MKVIKYGPKQQRVKCKKCGSLLEYDISDIHTYRFLQHIVCPVCKNHISVDFNSGPVKCIG